MKPPVYKVIFEGDVMPGFGQLDVQKKMASLFCIEVEVAARLFMGKQFEVKRGVTLEQAKNYVRALAKLGAITYLIPYEGSDKESELSTPPDQGVGEFTNSGSFTSLAFTAYFENKLKAREEETGSHELIDPGDNTQPGDSAAVTDTPIANDTQKDIRQREVSADRSQGAGKPVDSVGSEDPTLPIEPAYPALPVEREDSTLPGGYPVYTDVNKIKEMQQVTLRMLAQKKLYE